MNSAFLVAHNLLDKVGIHLFMTREMPLFLFLKIVVFTAFVCFVVVFLFFNLKGNTLIFNFELFPPPNSTAYH